jgi:hypothetical protein
MNYFYLICNDGYDANNSDQPVSAFDICMKRLEEKKMAPIQKYSRHTKN